jgi:hypothetical protein
LRLVNNNAEMVGSHIGRELLAEDSSRELGKTYLNDVTAGDVIKLQMAAEVINTTLLPYYNLPATTEISASIDITRIR